MQVPKDPSSGADFKYYTTSYAQRITAEIFRGRIQWTGYFKF